MTPTTFSDAVTHLNRLCRAGDEGRTDGELLRRFAADRDEAAFQTLVARHARLVWGVAARHAADRHAAEDAFQATFFALARLAGRLRGEGSLAGWLHTVAARAARRTRRRAAAPADAPEPTAPDLSPLDALSARELLAVLDDEIAGLPDRYRQPVLLCCLEGLSRDEAAVRLGWPAGSVKGRLERGRNLLRRRLAARGVGLPAALAVLAVAPAAAPAALPAATADAAARFAAGAAAGRAADLARELVRAASLPRRALAAAVLAAAVLVAGGLGFAAAPRPSPTADPPPAKPADEPGPTPADADPDAPRVRVRFDGKPAVGAKVWAFHESHDPKAKPPAEPTPLVTGPDGTARLPLPLLYGRSSTMLFARDAAGRVGEYRHHSYLVQVTNLVIDLVPTTRMAGRVTDADGKPLAGVEVTTARFARPAAGTDADHRAPAVAVPPWEAERFKAKTDADGRFAFPGVPAEHLASMRVKSDGHGEVTGTVRVGDAVAVTLPKAGSVRVAFSGEGTAADAKGMEWTAPGGEAGFPVLSWNPALSWYQPPPGKASVFTTYATGTFDGTAPFVIPNLSPGSYTLVATGGGPVPVLPKDVKFEVKPGATTEVTVPLTKLAKVTGRVLDADTGKPVAAADVGVTPTDRVPTYPNVSGSVKTDADGRYVAHLPPGYTVTATVNYPPAGYLPPEYKRGVLPTPDVKLTAAGHAFPDIKLRKSATFTATVVGDDGKPVSALVYPATMNFGGPNVVAAGADGTFTLPDLDPQDLIAPRVRRGSAVNVPKAVEIGDPGGPVTVAVSEANAFRLAGRVTDGRGRPVAGAAVAVTWEYRGVGKRGTMGTSRVLETLTTGADGRYRSSALWPTDTYRVTVSAPGYGKAEAGPDLGVAGKTHDADVRLSRSDLAVRGTVVDLAGNPVAGAKVFNRGDGESEMEATADIQGRFELKGFRDGPAFVFARKDGHRTAAVPADPGGEPVRVVLRTLTDPPSALPSAAAHEESLKKLTRHLLDALWAERAKLDGFERTVFDAMAKLDPATARVWAEGAKKAGEKTDFVARLAKAEQARKLIEAAKADPEDALARVADRKGQEGFAAAFDLGKALLPTHKAQAARVAEEAVVRARGLDMPQRAWWLAEAGHLAARAGNVAGGRAVIAEAATLAEKLPADGLNGFYRGYAAGYLAPFDRPRAEKMLAAHTDPDDYNRYLALAIDRVATFDPTAARGMLEKFRSGNSFYQHEGRLFLAYRLAATDPDGATKLVAGVTEAKYRTLGYVHLARLVAPKDRPRAWVLIDTAFAQFDKDPQAFESWTNFGGPAAVAGVVAAAATDLGHPDAAGGAVRALALRPTIRSASSPQRRDEQAVKVALVLSFVDPAVAARVLAGVAPPEQLAERAVTGGRDDLFAVALVSPDRGPALVDRRLKTFLARKSGRGGVSDSGLIELLHTLTAADRLGNLTTWVSLPRVNSEWEE